MRYLAMKHGYTIADPFVDYQANQLIDDFHDFFNKIAGPELIAAGLMPGDMEAAVKANFEDHIPAFMPKIEQYAAGPGRFLFGDKLTYADFWIGAFYNSKCACKDLCWGHQNGEWAAALQKTPAFVKFGEEYNKELANYLASRPAYPF